MRDHCKPSSLFLFFKVDSAWIAYNKPKSPELANEYAGFLMALGLNGHLTKLATLNIHDYLTKVHTQRHACLHLEFHSTQTKLTYTQLIYYSTGMHSQTSFRFNEYFLP